MGLRENQPLPFLRVGELEVQPPEQTWLIQSLWTNNSVGILGGAPKCCKSWLGLDMAVSVASGTPCLDRFEVKKNGGALVYLAEDALSDVRLRIEALCTHRRINIHELDLFVITSSTLRLDLDQDQQQLQATLNTLKPRLLLLDPLVRLHRLDENSSNDISRILGFLRLLQRKYHTSIVLVHHASKKQRAQPGQALRGSSDLHAFGDSNVYLARRQDRLILTLEHRMAKPLDPLEIKLVSDKDNSTPHLEVVSATAENALKSLTERTLALLRQNRRPLPRTTLRGILKVNNQRLGQTLLELEEKGFVLKGPDGWVALGGNNSQIPTGFDQHEKEMTQNEL